MRKPSLSITLAVFAGAIAGAAGARLVASPQAALAWGV
jgi:hypothetical protein